MPLPLANPFLELCVELKIMNVAGYGDNTTVILVVSKQPLKCTKHYSPPNMKVTVGIGSSFFPDHDDVELTGQTRQGVGKAGYVLR